MHVMHVIDSLAAGGAERMLVDLANAGHADGLTVSVCITRPVADLAPELHAEIPRLILDRHRRVDWSAMQQFARTVRDWRVDVLHAHGRSTVSLLVFMRTVGLLRQRIVMHDHYGITPEIPRWFSLWGRRLIAQYVGVAERSQAWAARAGLPAERVHVIGNALDLTRLQPDSADVLDLRATFKLPADRLIGVQVANVRHVKGIDRMLRVVAASRHRDRVAVLVAGKLGDDAYAAECLQLRDQLDLTDTVHFIGVRGDVPALLANADFALLTSRSETGPLVLIEYACAGLPFVAPHSGDIAGRLASLDVAGFAPVDDESGLTAALDHLLDLSPAERDQRGQHGREVALREFDIRAALPQWYAVYQAALNG